MTKPDPLLILQARIEARARLLRAGSYARVEDMMQPLYAYARRTGLMEKLGVKGIDDMMLAAMLDEKR